jgi:hypothetical protein
MCTAELHRGRGALDWFYNQVRLRGPWDFKQLGGQYADFGNFHYGATGKALGISDSILLRAAGWAHERGGNYDPAFGHWWWLAPYGDDPNDQTMIKAGINYYYLSKGQLMCVP